MEVTNSNLASIDNINLASQATVGDYFRETLQERQKNSVFDSASETVRESAPPIVKTVLEGLPKTTQNQGCIQVNTQQLIMDGVADQAKRFEQAYGYPVPDAVYDSAFRSVLPLINQDYANAIGVGDIAKRAGVYDEVSNVSGGAMRVQQIAVAIMRAFSEQIPFAGVSAVGRGTNGLEGRIILVEHMAQSDVGGYKQGDSLDGLDSGKPFMQSKRYVDAAPVDAEGLKYSATIKLSDNDTNGCAIRSDTVQLYVNGILAAGANPGSRRGEAVAISSRFKLIDDSGTDYRINVDCNDPTKGELVVTFDKKLPQGSRVRFSADIDFEHQTLKEKRPTLISEADVASFRIHYASGYYKFSQEAKHQWQSDVNLDLATQATIALRDQYYNERHHRAIECMYEIGQSYQSSFSLDWQNRLNERSISSVVDDIFFSLSKVNSDMVSRTQLSSLGVIYVGRDAVPFFEAMDNYIFVPSGVKKKAGIYRVGKWCGLYDVYCTPSPCLNKKTFSNAFQMLCIGRSDQIAGNPYITGDAVAPIITPFSITHAGEQGAFYFAAMNDTVNPFPRIASAAAIINVTNIS